MPDGLRYDENGDILLGPDGEPPAPVAGVDQAENLAEIMDETTLAMIGSTLTEQVANDQYSRHEWEQLAKRFVTTLGIGPESAPDDFDYEASDTSDHPLLLNALTKFQAKALAALMPAPQKIVEVEPAVDTAHIEDVRVRKETNKRLSASAERVRQFYTTYLLEMLPSYEEDTDQIIHDCGLYGIGFRRICVDPSYRMTPVRPAYIRLEDLILSYDATNFRGTGRITHKYRVTATDLVRGMQQGTYRPVAVVPGMDLTDNPVTQARDKMFGIAQSMLDSMDSHTCYDVFTHLFLREDPHPDYLARPYVVTIHGGTQEILAVRRNWHPRDPDETPIEHFAGYVYSPGRNALTSIGLGALLTNMTLALRKAQRRGLDAAYLANHPSGFMLGGMTIRDDAAKFRPGELRPVDISGSDITKGILINPFKGPDPGLLQLYDRMNDSGKELGNIASIDFASMMKSGIAAGPALAAYDESTEFQTSVHRRLYRGHAIELRLIHARLLDLKGGQRWQYAPNRWLEPEDLQLTRPVPAMKPGHVSRQRSLIEAQAVYDVAVANPQEMNKREALHRYLLALGLSDPDAVMVPDPAETPIPATDSVNEYMRAMKGEPLRAAPTQNHRAHIEAHKAQLAGLQSSELPIEMGRLVSAALAAHIAEHEALELAVQVAGKLGLPFDLLLEGIPPEMEVELAPQIAVAVAEVEAARRQDKDADPRVVVEQIRAENKLLVEQMKAEQAESKRRTDIEIARMREEAETYRNITDNLYAIEIAEHKLSGKPPAKPNVPAPPNLSPRTQMPRFDFKP